MCTDKAKNLGVVLDKNLKMNYHINSTIRTVNLELRRISQMKSFLPSHVLKTVVSSLVLSRLDYCNSLLAGLPDISINKLQRAQNRAARLILDIPCSNNTCHTSSVEMLKTLHWLPIKARIEYKLSIFSF